MGWSDTLGGQFLLILPVSAPGDGWTTRRTLSERLDTPRSSTKTTDCSRPPKPPHLIIVNSGMFNIQRRSSQAPSRGPCISPGYFTYATYLLAMAKGPRVALRHFVFIGCTAGQRAPGVLRRVTKEVAKDCTVLTHERGDYLPYGKCLRYGPADGWSSASRRRCKPMQATRSAYSK